MTLNDRRGCGFVPAMTKAFSRRMFLGGGLAALGGAALAEAPLSALRPFSRPDGPPMRFAPGERPLARTTVQDIIARARLGGTVGYVLADAATGQVWESGASNVPLPPASVTKSVTALYALEALGAEHRFATRVLASGPVENGVVQGDLILAGGGDPVLVTDDIAALVDTLRRGGITGVTGAFRVWGAGLPYLREIEPSQLDHLGYNPAVAGLNLNFNRVHFEWARSGSSYNVAMDARSETLRPPVRVARMRVVDRSLPIYTYADGGEYDDWTVARAALGDGGSRWLPVRRPLLYAAEVFRAVARDRGLSLPAAEVMASAPDGTELARHDSGTLAEIARGMLLYSTNLTAEVLGLSATAAMGTRPESLAQSAGEMTNWLRGPMGRAGRFVDHSGLSDASAISARQMVALMNSPGVAGRLRPLLKPIQMLDGEGRALSNPPGSVLAKTGTLNFVSTLAGYITTAAGTELTFAIFCANLAEREASKSSQDELPEGAGAYNWRAKRLQQELLQRWARVYAG